MSTDYHSFVNRHLPLVERGCTSKARYVSRREAVSYARHGRRMDGGVAPYHCQLCGYWHLGHRRRRT